MLEAYRTLGVAVAERPVWNGRRRAEESDGLSKASAQEHADRHSPGILGGRADFCG